MAMTTKTRKKTETPKLPAKPFAFEVLQLVSKQRAKAKKVEILREYAHDSLKAIFIWNFDESVISLLPPGEVPYLGEDGMEATTMSDKINRAAEAMESGNSLGATDQKHTTLRTEYTKLYNFIQGGNPGLSNLRRESIFIGLLEGLHPLEAEIICLCKDKQLSTKYKITKEIVAEAFPDITWGGRS